MLHCRAHHPARKVAQPHRDRIRRAHSHVPIRPASNPSGHPRATELPGAAPANEKVRSAAQARAAMAPKFSVADAVGYAGTAAESTAIFVVEPRPPENAGYCRRARFFGCHCGVAMMNAANHATATLSGRSAGRSAHAPAQAALSRAAPGYFQTRRISLVESLSLTGHCGSRITASQAQRINRSNRRTRLLSITC
jgi:hypothetical protein